MLKKFSLLLCALVPLLFCGCKGYRETNQGLFVTALCFEGVSEGYNAAIEVVYSAENESNIKREVLYSSGATPALCIAALSSSLTRELYFEHCGAIVINESATDSQIEEIINYCKQDSAMSLSSFLAVTPDLQQMLEASFFSGNIGFDIMGLMKRIRNESKINFSNRIYETQYTESHGGECALPRLCVKEGKISVLGERIYRNSQGSGEL